MEKYKEVRCPDCGTKQAEIIGKIRIKCRKCKIIVEYDTNKKKQPQGFNKNSSDCT